MSEILKHAGDLFSKGGPVMWVLLAVSIVSLALSFERALFWFSIHKGGRNAWIRKACDRLRAGDEAGAKAMAAQDQTVYGEVIESLLKFKITDSTAIGLTEQHRHVIEKFNSALSTIVTGAPLIGLLGTVTGIIHSFDLIGNASAVRDIPSVAQGVSEALLNTAAGLGIALFTLVPYVIFRGQAERCLSRIEILVVAAEQGRSK